MLQKKCIETIYFSEILLIDPLTVLYQKIVENYPIYASVTSVYEKQSNQFKSQGLSKMWSFGLRTTNITLKDTT